MQVSEKVLCTRCGQRSKAEAEAGDFPGRCQVCGGLTCPPESPNGRAVTRPLEAVPAAVSPIKRGALATILSSRRPVDAGPGVSKDTRATAVVTVTGAGAPGGLLEGSVEMTSVQLRQKAVRRAQLRGSYQALGLVSAAVLLLAMLLAVSAFVLNVRSKTHASPAQVDAVRGPGG